MYNYMLRCQCVLWWALIGAFCVIFGGHWTFGSLSDSRSRHCCSNTPCSLVYAFFGGRNIFAFNSAVNGQVPQHVENVIDLAVLAIHTYLSLQCLVGVYSTFAFFSVAFWLMIPFVVPVAVFVVRVIHAHLSLCVLVGVDLFFNSFF